MNLKRFYPLILLFLVGCNGSLPEYQGTASWNGKPIKAGYVEFTPTDDNGQIVGSAIVDGKFAVRTVPGSKRVAIRGKRVVGQSEPTDRNPNSEPIYHFYIPEKFNVRTELSVVFESSNRSVVLELEGEEQEYQEAPGAPDIPGRTQ